VAVHGEYGFEADPDAAETIEAGVVQDADNPQRSAPSGSNGRSRTAAPAAPLRGPDRERDDPVGAYEMAGGGDDGSTMRHVPGKLLRLHEGTNTATGRALAAEGHASLESPVERFERE